MKTLFKHSYKTFITVIFLITVLSSFVIKSDVKKEGGKTTIPFWKQANAPDYTAAYLNPKPENKEPDKKQAKEFMANAKQNVSFLENKGQMMDTEGKPVPFVLFKAEAPGMNVYITKKGLTYVFVKLEEDEEEEKEERKPSKHQDLMMPGKHEEKLKAEMAWINVNLKGATIKRENIIKEEQSAEHFNYFYGHCPDGIYDVYQYKKLTIKNVYPHIDWVFYNSQKGGMKYDFILHPGANPNDIKLIYESEKPLDLDEKGNLQLKTKLGTLTENAPYSYLKETNAEIKSSFKTTKLNKHEVEVAFNINQNSYTQNSTLVIDPQLVWGTFYGGNDLDGPKSIDTDNNGNVFLTGYVASTNLPLQNAGTFFQSINISVNVTAFVLKFSNNGVLLWATYYGGSGEERGNFICTDFNGNVFITGSAGSPDFPVQNAGTYFQGTLNGFGDAFILKFDNNGNRLWATRYGGSGGDTGNSICSDSNGNIFVTGDTGSSDFPLQNAGTFFQGTLNGGADAFILKFDNNGNRLWATRYGGSGFEKSSSICTDANGNVFLSGYTDSADFPVQDAGTYFQGTLNGDVDIFILKFDNIGTRLWATFYGGSGYDANSSICTDTNGNVFIAGWTASIDLPVQNAGTFFQGMYGGGNADGFILKFSSNGTRLWATYFGDASDELLIINDLLAIDQCDNVYVGYKTASTTFPHLINSSNCAYYDNSSSSGLFTSDIIIARFTNAGSLTWCSYLGGDGADFTTGIAVDRNNNLFITGEWGTSNTVINNASYPLTNPGMGAYFDNTFNGKDDGYIVKFTPSPLGFTSSSVLPTCICDGSATFSITTCGEAPYNYVWSDGTSVLNSTLITSSITNLCSGVYNVTVTSAGCQKVVETYTISGGGLVAQANILPGNAICAGQSLTLSTIAANSYTWAGPNNFIANTQNAVINNAQVTSSGVYTISIDSGPGCAATATVAANVQAIEQPTVSFTYQSPYCTGTGNAQASLSNGFSTGGIFSSDAGLIIDANTGDIDLSASAAGTYIVTYNSAAVLCKAAGSNTAQVILNNSPILELNPSNIKLSCGASATITVTGADDYTWSNSSLLDCATCSVVVASPYKTTDFCVTGTSNNCTSQTCVNVTTEQTLDVPNAFTPNGDNNNDEFCLQGWAGCVQSFAISVFDRWGQEVFTSNKANFCWDGTYQGKALNTAVFVYSIKATIDGKQISKKGNITLLR